MTIPSLPGTSNTAINTTSRTMEETRNHNIPVNAVTNVLIQSCSFDTNNMIVATTLISVTYPISEAQLQELKLSIAEFINENNHDISTSIQYQRCVNTLDIILHTKKEPGVPLRRLVPETFQQRLDLAISIMTYLQTLVRKYNNITSLTNSVLDLGSFRCTTEGKKPHLSLKGLIELELQRYQTEASINKKIGVPYMLREILAKMPETANHPELNSIFDIKDNTKSIDEYLNVLQEVKAKL